MDMKWPWPRQCSKCAVTFIAKRPATDPEKEIKVTQKCIVLACPRATQFNCACKYAICCKCVVKVRSTDIEDANGTTRRSKRSKTHDGQALMCGEILVNGVITAVQCTAMIVAVSVNIDALNLEDTL